MPVAFDTSGMEQYDERTWFCPRTGDQVSLTYIDLVPDLPAPLDDLPLLRHRLALETAEIGALIEAHVVTIDSVPTLYQLLKLPIPDQESGQAFIAAFTVAKANCSAVLRIQCAEGSPTGVRESAVIGQVGPGAFVRPHPYAPALEGRLPWHVGDEERWDGRFPDHPLSRARAWANRTMATARIDPAFAQLPPFTLGGPGPNDHTDYHQAVERPALPPAVNNGRRDPDSGAHAKPDRGESAQVNGRSRPDSPRAPRRSKLDSASAWQVPPPDPEPSSVPSSRPSSVPSSGPSSRPSSRPSSEPAAETIGARASHRRRAAEEEKANSQSATHRMPSPDDLKVPPLESPKVRSEPAGSPMDRLFARSDQLSSPRGGDSADALARPSGRTSGPLRRPTGGGADQPGRHGAEPVGRHGNGADPMGAPGAEPAGRRANGSDPTARPGTDVPGRHGDGAAMAHPGGDQLVRHGADPMGWPGAEPLGGPGNGADPTARPAADQLGRHGNGTDPMAHSGGDQAGRHGNSAATAHPGGDQFGRHGTDPMGRPGAEPVGRHGNGTDPMAVPGAAPVGRPANGSDPRARPGGSNSGPLARPGGDPRGPVERLALGPASFERTPGTFPAGANRIVSPDGYPSPDAARRVFPAEPAGSTPVPQTGAPNDRRVVPRADPLATTDVTNSSRRPPGIDSPTVGASPFPDPSAASTDIRPGSLPAAPIFPPAPGATGNNATDSTDITPGALPPFSRSAPDSVAPAFPGTGPEPTGARPGSAPPTNPQPPPATGSPEALANPARSGSFPAPDLPGSRIFPPDPIAAATRGAASPDATANRSGTFPSASPDSMANRSGTFAAASPDPTRSGAFPGSSPDALANWSGTFAAGSPDPARGAFPGSSPDAANGSFAASPDPTRGRAFAGGSPNAANPSFAAGSPDPSRSAFPGGSPDIAANRSGTFAAASPDPTRSGLPGGPPDIAANRSGTFAAASPDPTRSGLPGGPPDAAAYRSGAFAASPDAMRAGGFPGASADAMRSGAFPGGSPGPAANGPGAFPGGPPDSVANPSGAFPGVSPDAMRSGAFPGVSPDSMADRAFPGAPAGAASRSGTFAPASPDGGGAAFANPNRSGTFAAVPPDAFPGHSPGSASAFPAAPNVPIPAQSNPVGRSMASGTAYPSGRGEPIGSPQAVGISPGRPQSPASPGDVMHTVLIGLPIGGYVPLWHNESVSFWRLTDPAGLRSRLGTGVESRTEIDNKRFREAALFAPDTNKLFLLDRHRNGQGNLGGASTQLIPASEDEAYRAADDKAMSELYSWIGDVVVAAGQRGEFVAIETGGWHVPVTPVVLIMLRTDGREWHSVVETSPVPHGAPVWRDQQPVDGDTQLLASPATDRTMRAAGLLTRFAVATWPMHPFQLGLSFGPNPTLGDGPTR